MVEYVIIVILKKALGNNIYKCHIPPYLYHAFRNKTIEHTIQDCCKRFSITHIKVKMIFSYILFRENNN